MGPDKQVEEEVGLGLKEGSMPILSDQNQWQFFHEHYADLPTRPPCFIYFDLPPSFTILSTASFPFVSASAFLFHIGHSIIGKLFELAPLHPLITLHVSIVKGQYWPRMTLGYHQYCAMASRISNHSQ